MLCGTLLIRVVVVVVVERIVVVPRGKLFQYWIFCMLRILLFLLLPRNKFKNVVSPLSTMARLDNGL